MSNINVEYKCEGNIIKNITIGSRTIGKLETKNNLIKMRIENELIIKEMSDSCIRYSGMENGQPKSMTIKEDLFYELNHLFKYENNNNISKEDNKVLLDKLLEEKLQFIKTFQNTFYVYEYIKERYLIYNKDVKSVNCLWYKQEGSLSKKEYEEL